MKSLYVRCMDALHRCCLVVAGICLVVITLIIPYGVFTAMCSTARPPGPSRLAVLLMVWLSFYGRRSLLS